LYLLAYVIVKRSTVGSFGLTEFLPRGLAAHRFARAVELYTEAIELNPDNAVFYSNRAFAHTKLEEYGSAIQDATRSIELNPKYIKVESVFTQLTSLLLHWKIISAGITW
jgi:tetratricopeptide (TPR) repeat protein